MKNIELIYDKVREKEPSIKKKDIIITIQGNKSMRQGNKFTSYSLKQLLQQFKYIIKYRYTNKIKGKDILIKLGNIDFADKITYLILDAILYHLINITDLKIIVHIKDLKLSTIHNMGFIGTALYKNITSKEYRGYLNNKVFLRDYDKKYFCEQYDSEKQEVEIYHRYIESNQLKQKLEWPSIVAQDIGNILQGYINDEDWIDHICEVVSELVCNIQSHTQSDCLVDINFSPVEKSNNDKKYLSMNIAIFNFCNDLLYDKIKEKIELKEYSVEDCVYSMVYKAYNNHIQMFNKHYKEEDFFLITAFQNHVSSRKNYSGTGGTGLTSLIQNIINKTDLDFSYVLTGSNILFFRDEYLSLSGKEKFIGFNDQKDYINYRPAEKVIGESHLYIPGTIYNILLIKEL